MLEWRYIWNRSIETCQKAILANDQKGKAFTQLRESTDYDGDQPFKNDKMVDFEEGIAYECLKQYDKAIAIYEKVSSEGGLPVEHWRRRASLFLKRAKIKKAGCPASDDFGELLKPYIQWNAFYYLHSFAYLPHNIRYLSISSMSRVDSEPEMSIVIFRTCLEEVIRLLHPTEYNINDRNKKSFGPLLDELYKNHFLMTDDMSKLEEENIWCFEIVQRGNAAAHGNNHGNKVDYNTKYIDETIIFFIKIMDRANSAFKNSDFQYK